MTIVSSIQANSSQRRYAFASEESPIVVTITVPLKWDETSPEWVKNRCKQGLVCAVMSTPTASPRTIRLKRVVVNDSGKLCDLDWSEVDFELEALNQNTDVLLHSDYLASLISKKASRTYSKVFNKKVLDKKASSVV